MGFVWNNQIGPISTHNKQCMIFLLFLILYLEWLFVFLFIRFHLFFILLILFLFFFVYVSVWLFLFSFSFINYFDICMFCSDYGDGGRKSEWRDRVLMCMLVIDLSLSYQFSYFPCQSYLLEGHYDLKLLSLLLTERRSCGGFLSFLLFLYPQLSGLKVKNFLHCQIVILMTEFC